MPSIMKDGRLTDVGMRLAARRVASITMLPELDFRREESLRFCLLDVAAYIHEGNKQIGWWTDLHTGEPLRRNVGELLMLMVSEIAEIPHTGALSVMDDKLPERLMFEVELADCAIRIFDTVGALAPQFWRGYLSGVRATEYPESVRLAELDNWLMQIVRQLALAMEGHRRQLTYSHDERDFPTLDFHLGRALQLIFHVGKLYKLKVEDTLPEKLEYNFNRPDHKPENRRLKDGKAY